MENTNTNIGKIAERGITSIRFNISTLTSWRGLFLTVTAKTNEREYENMYYLTGDSVLDETKNRAIEEACAFFAEVAPAQEAKPKQRKAAHAQSAASDVSEQAAQPRRRRPAAVMTDCLLTAEQMSGRTPVKADDCAGQLNILALTEMMEAEPAPAAPIAPVATTAQASDAAPQMDDQPSVTERPEVNSTPLPEQPATEVVPDTAAPAVEDDMCPPSCNVPMDEAAEITEPVAPAAPADVNNPEPTPSVAEEPTTASPVSCETKAQAPTVPASSEEELERALGYIIPSSLGHGGKSLGELPQLYGKDVAVRELKWFAYSYRGKDTQLRRNAKLVLDFLEAIA